MPAEVALKEPKDFKLIGKQPPRVDSHGQDRRHGACSRIDVHLPGMLTAVIARPPRFGAKREEPRRDGGARGARA